MASSGKDAEARQALLDGQREEESERVLAWRAKCATDLGYDLKAACAIARDHSIDVHRLATLISQGCSLELAPTLLTSDP